MIKNTVSNEYFHPRISRGQKPVDPAPRLSRTARPLVMHLILLPATMDQRSPRYMVKESLLVDTTCRYAGNLLSRDKLPDFRVVLAV